jgi:GMP synthase-like glutamine amidotransferase
MIVIIKHISIEGPGIISEFFKNIPWEIKTFELDRENRLPEDLCGINAIISLGGPMSVYEEEKYPFLKVEDKFLRKAIKEEIPILGICLGAQLLAKACGAKVKKAKHEEVSWYKVSLIEDGKKDLLFKGLSNELDVFEWHKDTFEIPNNGTLLASSHHCRNQAFRFGMNAYGFQFHIEVTPDYD